MSYFNLNNWLNHNKTPKDILDSLNIYSNIPNNGDYYDLLKHNNNWIYIDDIVIYPKYFYISNISSDTFIIKHNLNSSNLQIQLYIYDNLILKYKSYYDYLIEIIDDNNIKIILNNNYKIKLQILNYN